MYKEIENLLGSNKMSEKERKNYLSLTIWFNLIIGIYNLYIFNEMSSTFHLVLGAFNIGVWAFNRPQLKPIFSKVNSDAGNKRRP